MSISKKTFTGVAREAVSGTAASVATLYTPKKSTFVNKTKYVYFNEDRGTRDGNYGRIASVKQSTATLQGSWYNDVDPYLLLAFMGTDTPTQPDATNAPTGWQHAMTLADVPPSLTLFKGYDVAAYSFAYSVVTKLKFSFEANGKVLEVDASTEGQYGTKLGAVPTPTFGTTKPFAGYAPTIKFSGTQTMDVEKLDVELDQKVLLFYAAAGSQSFATVYFGERTAKINYDARFDNDTQYQKFANDTDDAIDITFLGAIIGGTVAQKLQLTFPIVGYDEMELKTDKDNVMVSAKGTARPGTAANSLFTANVVNTVASYTV